jgi:hypothetical protein
MDEFDEALLNAVDEILRYTLGDISTQIIYTYIERTGCPKSEIPNKLDAFSEELRRILGSGRGQMLGSAPILEEAIAERLCAKLGKKLEGRLPEAFPIFIRKLKEEHYQKSGQSP